MSPSTDQGPPHILTQYFSHPRCGICGFGIQVAERFTTVIGNDDSSALRSCIPVWRFPKRGRGLYTRCNCIRQPRDGIAHPLPEAVMIHTDCLFLFMPWQNLWKCDPLYLEPRVIMKPSPNVAQALGIPMLDLLPTELLLIIRSYSFDSILWRLCATVNIAQQALNGNGNPQRLKTFRIGEVSAWKRGKEPILTNDSPRDPIIRLTLDAYRIKEVERLPSYSDTLSDQVDSSSTAFAFIDECFIDQRVELNDHLQIFDNTEAARISNAVFHFQFDRARLYFQPPLHGPWVWNTPSPAIRTVSMSSEDRNPTIMVYRTTNLMPLGPPTAHPLLQLFGSSYERVYQIGSTPPCSKGYRLHMFPYAQDRTSWRYYNISLHQTTGLTFLFKSGALYGVHSHTAKMPSAAKLLEWFPYGGGSTLSWVYVPLPPNDDIVAMGLHGRSRKAIMIRKRLSGDILVGYIPSSRPPHFALLNSPPLACVFNQLPSRMVNGFGAVVRDDSSSDNFIQVPTPRPRTSPPFQLGETLPSVASLEGLVRVSVYQAGNRGFCAGLLMEYRNGAQRTLGSCRLGVDPVNTWSEPTHICFLSRTRRDQDISYPIAKVEVTSQGQSHSHPTGWKCRDLSRGGSVEVWSSYRAFKILFLNGRA